MSSKYFLIVQLLFIIFISGNCQRNQQELHNQLQYDHFACDNNGNLYVLGLIYGRVDFDPHEPSLIVSSKTKSDHFLAKYNSGNEPVWVYTWQPNDPRGYSEENYNYILAVDDAVYISGYGYGIPDLYEFDNPLRATTSNYPTDINSRRSTAFAIKVNSDGILDWLRIWEASDTIYATHLQISPSGEIIVPGIFRGIVDFMPGQPEMTRETPLSESESAYYNGRVNSYFVARLNVDGEVLDVKTWESNGDKFHPIDLKTDTNGYWYLLGTADPGCDFSPDPINEYTLPIEVEDTQFLAKYDPNGIIMWAEELDSEDSSYTSIQFDAKNDCYLIYLKILNNENNGMVIYGSRIYRINNEGDILMDFNLGETSEDKRVCISKLEFVEDGSLLITGSFSGQMSDGRIVYRNTNEDPEKWTVFQATLDSDGKMTNIQILDDYPYEYMVPLSESGEVTINGLEFRRGQGNSKPVIMAY